MVGGDLCACLCVCMPGGLKRKKVGVARMSTTYFQKPEKALKRSEGAELPNFVENVGICCVGLDTHQIFSGTLQKIFP